jgi:acetolactate synthase-1/2/3 large subunit
MSAPGCSAEAAETCARALVAAPFGVWVGFGARHASAQIRELVARTGAGVLCTPRAKGVFPEDHPRFAGVTGFGGHDGVKAYLAVERPERMLVLGTRLGEFSSFWDAGIVPPKGLIHVDLDPAVPGAAYPGADMVTVCSDVVSFLDAVLARIPAVERPPSQHALSSPRCNGAVSSVEPDRPRVRASALMAALQRVVVDGSDALVIAEGGNSFAWTTHLLRFATPGRYRVSMGWASMGHAVAGVVGAAHARRRKVVAVVGDGAMLMNSEVSTAVAHRVPAVWVVLNDARYGMIAQGLAALGMEHGPSATEIPPCDFAAVARAMGASGVRVHRERDIVPALEQAMESPGPFVVDVIVDPAELAPSGTRFRSIAEQWAQNKGTSA